jgi:hypothetical protein
MLHPMYRMGEQQKAPVMRFPHPVGAALLVIVIGVSVPAAAQAPSAYWCDPARAYYPQVQSCPAPWRLLNTAQGASQPARTPAWTAYPTQYAPYDNYNHGNGP